MSDLTADAEMDAAVEMMQAFAEFADPPPPPPRPPRPPRTDGPPAPPRDGERVGDAYNRAADWRNILEPKGWQFGRKRDRVQVVTRPGKDPKEGISATIGHCRGKRDEDRLYVFTSSAPPFEPKTSYSKLAAYTLLFHGGDYTASVRELAKRYAPPPARVGPGVPTTLAEPAAGGGEAPAGEPPPASADEDDVAGIIDLKNAGAAVRWVWPKWIQRGVVTAVAAQGGTGKTRFTADLVRRVTHGLPWPDGAPTGGHDGRAVALWVVADNHHDEMVTLAESFRVVEAVRVNAPKESPYDGVVLEMAEDFAALERRVRKVRPLFVVVDTVGNATDKNLSRQEDAKAFYQPLQLLARRCDVAVLCLTHLNASGKALGRRVMEKVRTCIRLSAKEINKTDCKRRLEVTKSNSSYPDPLAVTMGDAGNEYSDRDVPPPPEEDDAGPAAKPVAPRTQECADWLADILSGGKRRVKDVRDAAEKAGYTAKVLYEAKRIAGVEETEADGGYKWWSLNS